MSTPEIGGQAESPLRDQPISELALVIREVLGDDIVAYALSLDDAVRLDEITEGHSDPSETEEAYLRDLAEVTDTFTRHSKDVSVIRAAMYATSQSVDGRSVLEQFHEGNHQEGLLTARYIGISALALRAAREYQRQRQ
jgi:hypothetical protein